MTLPLIIVGTGLAGYHLAKEWRKLDSDTPLIMISQDDGAFYSKPMISNALSKNKSPDDLPMATVEKMCSDLNATILTNTDVIGINTETYCLHLSRGEQLEYDQLVLALGASPVVLPMEGDAADTVYRVNNLQDYRQFRQAIDGKKHITILGPGLIGCEFANDLLNAGYQVCIVGPDDMPLSTLLPEVAAQALHEALDNEGVDWRLGSVCERIDHQTERLQVTLSNGDIVQTDVVLSAVGLRPNTKLATDAGIAANRGILVDRYLKTSADDIHALGDCIEIEDKVLPFVMPLMNAARALAKTLAGTPTRVEFPAMPVVVKTPSHAVAVSPPPVQSEGEWRIEKNEDGVMACYYAADESLLGFALTGKHVDQKQRLTKLVPPVLS